MASSRVQLRVTRSTLGNNSIVTLHDGEGNPFAPAAGALEGRVFLISDTAASKDAHTAKQPCTNSL